MDDVGLLSVIGGLFFGSLVYWLLKGWFWAFSIIPSWFTWKLWIMLMITFFIILVFIGLVSGD
jgi:hypothetical protein